MTDRANPVPATVVFSRHEARMPVERPEVWLHGGWVLARHPDGSVTAFSGSIVDRVEFHKP